MNRRWELEDWCTLALVTTLTVPLVFVILCAIFGADSSGLVTVEHEGHKFIKSESALIHHPDCCKE